MKTVLHIGINKTGTSTLQFFLWNNRELLSQQGICYPSIGVRYGAHHGVAAEIWTGPDIPVNQDFAPPIAATWHEDLLKEAEGHDRLLLSSEFFHYRSCPEKVAEIFKPAETTVVVYLRDHTPYIASWYQQNIQSGNTTCSVLDFAKIHNARQVPFLKAWVDVYGKDRVIARHYDRELLVKKDIVADFFDSAGLAIDLSEAKWPSDRNISISGNWLFFKLLLNNVITYEEAQTVKDEAGAMAVLDPSFRGSLYVDEQGFKDISWIFKEDRMQMKNQFGINFARKAYVPKGHKSPELDRLRYDWELLKAEMVISRKKLLHYFKRLPEF